MSRNEATVVLVDCSEVSPTADILPLTSAQAWTKVDLVCSCRRCSAVLPKSSLEKSMLQPFRSLKGHNMTRFDAAREIAWHYLARKALEQRKTVEVGVVAFGTDETENPLAESMEEYNNIMEVAQLETVSIDNIRRVKELQPSSVAGELLAGACGRAHTRIVSLPCSGTLV